jgi:hypothetical protein
LRGPAEQNRWDAFLASDGGDRARTNLLKGQDWTQPRQDGRNSQAVVALAEQLKRYKSEGRITGVRSIVPDAFDFSAGMADDTAGMAGVVAEITRAQPDALVIVYSGSIHAMKSVPEEYHLPQLHPAAGQLPASETVAINLIGRTGAAWNCQGADPSSVDYCRGHPYQGADYPRAIVSAEAVSGTFDQIIVKGFDALGYTGVATTASPPAVDATSR